MKIPRAPWLVLVTVAIAGHAHVQAGDTNLLTPGNPAADAKPQWTTSGVIYGPDGTPASGAVLRVWRSANPFQEFTSADDGTYIVHWKSQPQPPTSRAPKINSALIVRDAARNLVATRDLEEADATVNVQLQTGLTIAGLVQDVDGRPLPNADVALHMWINRAGAELTRTQSETNGTFSFTAMPPAGDFAVEATARGYSRERIQLSDTRAKDNRIELPPIELLPATSQIAGTVVGLDNQPVAGVMVSLSAVGGQPGGSVRTDAEGHFRFDAVVEGAVSGFASVSSSNWGRPELTGRFRTQSGDTNILVILQPVQSR